MSDFIDLYTFIGEKVGSSPIMVLTVFSLMLNAILMYSMSKLFGEYLRITKESLKNNETLNDIMAHFRVGDGRNNSGKFPQVREPETTRQAERPAGETHESHQQIGDGKK